MEMSPPVKLTGFKLSVEIAAANGACVSVRGALSDVPPQTPEIEILAVELTGPLFIKNAALLLPAGRYTLLGTPATALLLLDSITVLPPDGAGAARVTEPCAGVPPTTLAGLTVIAARATPFGVTLSVDVIDDPPDANVRVAASSVETACVWMLKEPWLCPRGMTKEEVTETAPTSEDTVTDSPPFGAGALRVTVPTADRPPLTLGGLNVMEATLLVAAGAGALAPFA